MNRSLVMLILSLAGLSTARAADGPPSEASLKHLFEVSHISRVLDSVWDQMDGMMSTAIKQANQGQPLNDAQKAIAEDTGSKLTAIYRESMSWEKLEPIMIRVYQKSLTQSEVDGIARFYATPAGQAMLKKLPAIMQNSMHEMQGAMQDMMPKIQALARDSAEKIRAAATPPPADAPAAPTPPTSP
ncbi:MAG TPA: DUF2059 domain-containing protein [Burkholderiaceae bacterium]|nr:DUF2059 domain-containing protein [Burkholderiaceae bacterium]